MANQVDWPALTCRAEDSVVAEIGKALRKWPLAEEVYLAAEWRIARDPNCGTEIPDSNLQSYALFLPPNKLARSPGLLVRFHYLTDEPADVSIDWIKYYEYDPITSVLPKAFFARGR